MNETRTKPLDRLQRSTEGLSSGAIFSLHAIAFFSGAVVLLLEVLASRVLGPYLGTSFSVWVNIIGTILAALSAGYFLGGVLADRNQKLLPYIFLVAAAACSFVRLGKPLLPHIGALGLTWGSLVAAILFFAPASLVLGTVSPYLLKIATKDTAKLGRTAGGISAASTLGSIAGTFVGGFWLIPKFPISSILAGMVVVLLGLSLWSAGGLKKYWIYSVAALTLVLLSVELPVFSGATHTVFETNSQYYNIRVNDIQMFDAPYRWLLLDGSTQAARFLDQPNPATPYADLSLRLMRGFKPSPTSALLLGGGGYTIPELIKSYSPQTDVTVVEIDPEVTAVAKRFFLNDPAMPITTLNEDARVFLNNNHKQYDLVFSDVYSSAYAVPPALASREALELMRRTIKPGGIIVFNICSARDGELSLVYQSLYTTISSVFPHIAVYSTMPDSPESPQNMIVVASNQSLASENDLPDSLRQFRSRTAPAPGILLTDDYAPTDYLVSRLARATYPWLRSLQ